VPLSIRTSLTIPRRVKRRPFSMRKRVILFKRFRKDGAPTPPLQTPGMPLTTSNSSLAQPAPVAQGVISVRESEVNPALELAIQKHLNDLPDADRDAFREESRKFSQDCLLYRANPHLTLQVCQPTTHVTPRCFAHPRFTLTLL